MDPRKKAEMIARLREAQMLLYRAQSLIDEVGEELLDESRFDVDDPLSRAVDHADAAGGGFACSLDEVRDAIVELEKVQ